jgi:hypothetical protein
VKGEDKILVWVDAAVEDATKAALPKLARHAVAKSVEVSGDALRDNIRSFVSKFATLLDEGRLGNTNVVIEEIELSLAVTTSGSVELLGKLAAGGEAGIKVKLKRQSTPK